MRRDRNPISPVKLTSAVLAVCLASSLGNATGLQNPGSASTRQHEFIETYCISCHTARQQDLGNVPVALDNLNPDRVASDAATWEKVIRKLRAGMMPPAGIRRPPPEIRDDFVQWLEDGLDRAARANPNPGRTEALHRLNRNEYQNAVRDLLSLEVDVGGLLPADDASYGFDNIAGVLGMSPTLIERYLNAARRISRLAIGTTPPFPSIDYFRVADDLAQDDHLTGLGLGTRGGTLLRYSFPMDAEYTIGVELMRDLNESVPVYREPQYLEVSIDGERVAQFTLPGVGTSPQAPAEPPPPVADDEADPRAQGTDPDRESGERPRPEISQVARGPRLSPAERAARNRIDETWEARIPVKAGTRDIQVAFVKQTSAKNETIRLPFLRPYPAGVNIPETRMGAHLKSVEITGPHSPSGPGSTPSRERIFVCRPGAASSDKEREGCARTILSELARRAYRRPVTETDLEPLLSFYREGAREGGFDGGIEHALRRVLVSAEFLFRVSEEPEDLDAGAVYAIDDLELASRLSFFLWSSIPDEELLSLAEAGRLGDPTVLESQVHRMINDDRFGAFVRNFAGQWLFLRNLEATIPVQSIFPDFDDTLRQAFRRETELFFESIAREDRSALELLDSDYTFLNERLALHYGIPNVKGSHFRRVSLAEDSMRGGLLGQGSILTVTSYPDRTSPVVRGKWILENLLGSPPPDPPPNVPELEASDFSAEALSIRQRMAQHRANPVCASCHSMMDPLGLSLENFNAVGMWRTLDDAGTPVDATGALPDGTPFEGPDGLRSALLDSDLFVTTLTEKLLTYALGRGVEYYDQPAVRAIVDGAADADYRLSSLIVGVVQSPPFRLRTRSEN